MTSLLSLVAPLLGGGILEPTLLTALDGVTATVPELTTTRQAVGTAAPHAAWALLRDRLPLPLIDTSPFAVDLAVDGQRIGPTGWELGISLPAVDVPIPGLQPGAIVVEQDGRSVVRSVPGVTTLHVDASQLTIRSEHGDDPVVLDDGLVVGLRPDVVVLLGGFGLVVGELRLDTDGIHLPALALVLPPLPMLPTGPIDLDATIRPVGGVFVRTPTIDLPELPGIRAASIRVTIDRPNARSLADLVPTSVEITVPLDGASATIPAIGEVTPSPVAGGPLALSLTVTALDDRLVLRGAIAATGSEHGVVRLTAATSTGTSILAAIAAFGPFVADGDVAELAALAGVGAAVATGVAADGVTLAVHSLALEASWDQTPPGIADTTILLDYECQLPMSFGEGAAAIATTPGGPYRVRHRDVVLRVAPVPGLSFHRASSTVSSIGDWIVPKSPAELVRVAAVRMLEGSLDIEVDLALALDLGIVTVDQSTVRVSISAGGVEVQLPAFTASIDVPGVIVGRGRMDLSTNGFEAGLDVQLPAIGVGGRAAVGVRDGMVMLAIEVDLPVPIPFANSGLGLFGVGGVLAANARPDIDRDADPITTALAWDPWKAGAWAPQDGQTWIGLSADIGTVPDLGFALSAEAVIVLGVPDPSIRAALNAELLSGLGGTLKGVLTIDSEQLVIAVEGNYDVPHLVTARIPAGAIFPFDDLSAWSARIGGDRTVERGEPVSASVLPDLLSVEAWMFLMAFGDASTRVGDALSGGNGLTLTGMSLAFGAGFDVEWSCPPFGFEAGGVLLAALTHRPSDGAGWVLEGFAELHGSVDLGPISIGASAQLKAFVDPDGPVLFADAQACASVDLWFTELEGCVHLEIGKRPTVLAPAPRMPVRRLALSDRVGNVVAEAVTNEATPPSVWPDVIPVLVFETWVGAPEVIPGVGKVIGGNIPRDDGWIGTAELAYRFDLTEVRVFEVRDDGDVEVGTSWPCAWQLPLTHDVFGKGEPPAQARSLALNVLDLHHWLQPAVMLPEDAPGDPIGVLGRLCDPVPLPTPIWFPGEGAALPPAHPLRFPAADPQPGDPAAIDVYLRGEVEYRADAEAPLFAAFGGDLYRAPGLERLDETFAVDGHEITAFCWLPSAYHSDSRSAIVLRVDDALHNAVIHLLVPDGVNVDVDDNAHGGWSGTEEPVAPGWVHETWQSDGTPVREIIVTAGSEQQVGLFGVSGITDRSRRRFASLDRSRVHTHDALEAKANQVATTRRLMRRGMRHRVDVKVHWQSRGPMFGANDDVLEESFTFTTAVAGDRPPSPAHTGGDAFTPVSLFAATTYSAMFDQSLLAHADLGRYVAGFVPPDATTLWFTDDVVQVQFLVDHLTELAAAYDSTFSVAARRTDGAPNASAMPVPPTPIEVPQAGDPGAMVAAPYVANGLTMLDRHRLLLAVELDHGEPAGCRLPRPGAAATVPLALEPDAAYRLTLTIDRIGAVAGSGAVIDEARFTTSRFASPIALIRDLGFRVDEPPGLLAAFPLPPDAQIPPRSAEFDTSLEALGLGGYGASPTGRSAGLWLHEGPDEWRFVGVLIESPEPIRRPGRFDVTALHVGGFAFDTVRWDPTGSRVLALGPAAHVAAPTVVTLRIADTPPGRPLEWRNATAQVAPERPGAGLP